MYKGTFRGPKRRGREGAMYHRSTSSPPILEQQQPCYSTPLSSPAGMASTPFRRALSTGDLWEEEPVRRYTVAERRESIERYRSKRKRRNFQKKITYACRKTLAESRRRIKGRFAHTGDVDGDQKGELRGRGTETEVNGQIPISKPKDEVDVDGGDSSTMPEWWPAMEEALAREEEDLDLFDGEMLASYLGVNLY